MMSHRADSELGACDAAWDGQPSATSPPEATWANAPPHVVWQSHADAPDAKAAAPASAAPDISTVTSLVVPRAALAAMLPTGNLDTTYHWNQGQSLGAPVTLAYCFSDGPPTYSMTNRGYTPASAQVWSAAQKATIEQVLAAYSRVPGLTFTQVNSQALSDISFFQSDSITVSGFANYPFNPTVQGREWGDVFLQTNSFPIDGSNLILPTTSSGMRRAWPTSAIG